MPLNLSNLISNRAAAVIDFGNGNLLNVEFLPAAITAETLAGLTALGNPNALDEGAAVAALQGVTKTLLDLLASWDLVDNGGDLAVEAQPVPIDADNLTRLGLMNEWVLLNGILAAQGNAGKS
ncbi:MAG TPA: hypothetical protein VFN11_14190 [Ktedonobacterales bacterium]|nr:hypothetical protein [Ktedonobacterales bacterium]